MQPSQIYFSFYRRKRIDSFDMAKQKKTKEYGGEKGKERLKRILEEKKAVQYKGKVMKTVRQRGASHVGKNYHEWEAENMKKGNCLGQTNRDSFDKFIGNLYHFLDFAAVELWGQQKAVLDAGYQIPKTQLLTMKGLARQFQVPFSTLRFVSHFSSESRFVCRF